MATSYQNQEPMTADDIEVPTFDKADFERQEGPSVPEGFYLAKIDAVEGKPVVNNYTQKPDTLIKVKLVVEMDANKSEDYKGKTITHLINLSAKKKLAAFYEACGYSRELLITDGPPKWSELYGCPVKIKVIHKPGKDGSLWARIEKIERSKQTPIRDPNEKLASEF